MKPKKRKTIMNDRQIHQDSLLSGKIRLSQQVIVSGFEYQRLVIGFLLPCWIRWIRIQYSDPAQPYRLSLTALAGDVARLAYKC
ncbi:hypothetical protein E2C01_060653 [Portunus trituberculatus]|uniref:Uncharacterized protein n=1 Tax=Portunus trituberculatus TaxID=210409 RepID=A0A5B7HA20_PORTR|nr:hypothetical protein [Portunus trituberculatus]